MRIVADDAANATVVQLLPGFFPGDERPGARSCTQEGTGLRCARGLRVEQGKERVRKERGLSWERGGGIKLLDLNPALKEPGVSLAKALRASVGRRLRTEQPCLVHAAALEPRDHRIPRDLARCRTVPKPVHA